MHMLALWNVELKLRCFRYGHISDRCQCTASNHGCKEIKGKTLYNLYTVFFTQMTNFTRPNDRYLPSDIFKHRRQLYFVAVFVYFPFEYLKMLFPDWKFDILFKTARFKNAFFFRNLIKGSFDPKMGCIAFFWTQFVCTLNIKWDGGIPMFQLYPISTHRKK